MCGSSLSSRSPCTATPPRGSHRWRLMPGECSTPGGTRSIAIRKRLSSSPWMVIRARWGDWRCFTTVRSTSYNRQRTAFFYLFESLEEPRGAEAVLEAGFDWARARGLDRIVGPKGFTAMDGMGVLVAGFEHRPALGIPYNPPSYHGSWRPPVSGRWTRWSRDTSTRAHRSPRPCIEASERIQQRRGLRRPLPHSPRPAGLRPAAARPVQRFARRHDRQHAAERRGRRGHGAADALVRRPQADQDPDER